MSLGIPEIILILVVILVLFGGKRIPELARGLGKAQAEYKKAKEAIEKEAQEFNDDVKKADKKKKTSAKKTVKKVGAKKTTVKKVSPKSAKK